MVEADKDDQIYSARGALIEEQVDIRTCQDIHNLVGSFLNSESFSERSRGGRIQFEGLTVQGAGIGVIIMMGLIVSDALTEINRPCEPRQFQPPLLTSSPD
jgi:hypothetical protein